jgi:hypothetical protein
VIGDRERLVELIREYAEHQSWRCDHPPHFYLAASCPYCDRRVGQPHEEGCRYVVPRSEGGRGSDKIVTRLDLGLGSDCPCGLLSALEAAGIDPEPWRPKEQPPSSP